MKKWLPYVTEGLLSGVIGAFIGGLIGIIVRPGGIVINVNTELLVILLAVLGLFYLLFRLRLKVAQLESEEKEKSGGWN